MRRTSFSLIFAATFAAAYFLAVLWNLTQFTYHPAIPEIGWGLQTPKDGPAMYWYGWIASATLLGLAAAILLSFLPRSIIEKWAPDLAWITPGITILALGWLLRSFFLRG
jgi:hypothetical protein